MILYVINVAQITKAQMVYLVREVQSMTSQVQVLKHLRVVMPADVEIAGHLVYEDVAAELATLLVLQSLHCLIKNF